MHDEPLRSLTLVLHAPHHHSEHWKLFPYQICPRLLSSFSVLHRHMYFKPRLDQNRQHLLRSCLDPTLKHPSALCALYLACSLHCFFVIHPKTSRSSLTLYDTYTKLARSTSLDPIFNHQSNRVMKDDTWLNFLLCARLTLCTSRHPCYNFNTPLRPDLYSWT